MNLLLIQIQENQQVLHSFMSQESNESAMLDQEQSHKMSQRDAEASEVIFLRGRLEIFHGSSASIQQAKLIR